MGISQIHASVEQADYASIHYGGVTYCCSVWLAGGGLSATGGLGGLRVEAKIHAYGEDGQLVLVDSAIVATALTDYVDCPRVLTAGTSRFVIHWINTDINDVTSAVTSTLYRSLFDLTAIATGWVSQGSVALHATNQYDHTQCYGDADGQFIVSRRTASGTITTTRYQSPWSWVDTVWSQADAGLTIANAGALACYADDDADTVVVSYQDTQLLRTYRRESTTGGSFSAPVETFADVLDGDNHFTLVRHEYYASGTILVIAEIATQDDQAAGNHQDYARLVAWRAISAATCNVLHESQWCWNLHLVSAWRMASGVTGQTEVYAAVAFKSIADGQEFDQQYLYVVRLDVAGLAAANAAGVMKPVPCGAIMGGSIDARPHGAHPVSGVTEVSIGARTNHSSRAAGPPGYTMGPHVKRKSFAVVRWGRLKQSQDSDVDTELQPVEAGIAIVGFDHEPPWTVRRDGSEPTQPATPAWKGVSRAISLPVETPAGLVFTGGVAQAYDGECLAELGFLWAPEIADIDETAMGGSSDMNGLDYHWYVNYVWPDNRGGYMRGPPSRPVTTNLADGEFATLRVRCANLSMLADATRYPLNSPVSIEVWRTYHTDGVSIETSSGMLLFRSEFGGSDVGWRLQDTPRSDPDAFTVDIVVGRANSTVQNNALAPYQLDPDTLQWTPPPPIPHQPLGPSALWQNRLFGVDPESGALVWSEEILPLGSRWEWPYFLDTSVFRLDGLGEVTALAAIENDLAIFTRDGIYTVAGDPGAGGSGNTFQLRTVARGIGCIEPRSVCVFTDGCTFQSAKRLHVLTRGLGIEDIGAPIEDLLADAGNVRSAVYLEDRDEIRFTLQAEPGTGPLLIRPRIAIFNLRTKTWVIRTLPMIAQSSTASRLNEHAHAIAWRGLQGETVHVILMQGGLARERSIADTTYSDEGASGSTTIRLDVTTEWIHLGMLDHTKRFVEIGIQTERVNDGALTVECWFDHDGSFDSDDGAAQQTLTIASPAPDFIRFRPEQGKCKALKLRIYEPNGVAATENVRLVALVIHWLAKPRRQGSRNNAA